MPHFTARAYRGHDDLEHVVALWLAARAAGLGDPWPSLDILHQELACLPDGTGDVRLWEDHRGRLVGAALLLDGCVLVKCVASGADDDALESAIIAWGQGRTRCATCFGERPALFVPVYDGDARLAALLQRAGLHEDG